MVLNDLPTPSLILDLDRLERNCDRMIRRAAELGVKLRPHMKTAKSVDVGRLATREHAIGVTVSTPAEVEHFAAAGFRDITYAVGIVAHKVPALAAMQRRHGARISLITDSVAAVREVARAAETAGERFAVFVEIDSGGGRGGSGRRWRRAARDRPSDRVVVIALARRRADPRRTELRRLERRGDAGDRGGRAGGGDPARQSGCVRPASRCPRSASARPRLRSTRARSTA